MKRIVVGLVASVAVALLAGGGTAFAQTFCASKSTGQLTLLTSGHCSGKETTVTLATTADLASRDAEIATLQTANANLQTLLSGVTRTGSTLLFTGMNLQLESGSGATDGAVNGLGNLIIGYDEQPTLGPPVPRTGSHDLILGKANSFTSFGGIVDGSFNRITAPFASVTGGLGNHATADNASVSGGTSNGASAPDASVSGGENNNASIDFASVSGGVFNTASGVHSSISGGSFNIANGPESSILGGHMVTVSTVDGTSP